MQKPIAASTEERIDQYIAAILRGEGERSWLVVLMIFAAASGGIVFAKTFSNSLIIHPDTHQFVFWMARWSEPGLFRGDLVADYWQSVSPWLYVAIYRGLNFFGIPPLVAAKLLPPVLIVATVFFAYRLALAFAGHSLIAFLGAVFVLLTIAGLSPAFGATPRGVALPVFLAVLDGLVRRRYGYVTISQFMLSGIYPQLALISLGVAGFTVLRWGPKPMLNLSARSLGMIGLIVCATAGGVLPVLLETGKYGPVVDLEQARSMAVFQSSGRTKIFDADGSLDVCGPRYGLRVSALSFNCQGYTDPRQFLNLLILAAPPILLFWHRLREARTETRPPIGSEIYLYVFLIAVIGFFIAHAVLFKLHLPNRYIDKPMSLVLPLALGHIAGLGTLWLLKRPAFAPGMNIATKKTAFYASWMLGLLVLIGAIGIKSSDYYSPNEPELISSLATLSPDKVFAGFVDDIDFVPVLAKRIALFTRKHSVPYHLGYYRQVETRMRDMVTAEFSTDPGVVADSLEKWSINIYLIYKVRLTDPNQRLSFQNYFVPDAINRARETRKGTRTALSKFASACLLREFTEIVMLDADCIVREARSLTFGSR